MRRLLLACLCILPLAGLAAGDAPQPVKLTLPESRLSTTFTVLPLAADGQPTGDAQVAINRLVAGGWRPSSIRALAGDRLLVQSVRNASSRESSSVGGIQLVAIPLAGNGLPTEDGKAALAKLNADGFRGYGLALTRGGGGLKAHILGVKSINATNPPETTIEVIPLDAKGMVEDLETAWENRTRTEGWRLNGMDVLDEKASFVVALMSRTVSAKPAQPSPTPPPTQTPTPAPAGSP